MKTLSSIEINLDYVKEGLRLIIDSRRVGSLFDAKDSAIENNEARFQILEGCFYDYVINDPHYFLADIGENIIQSHTRNQNLGILAPNIFVGTLRIPLFKTGKTDSETDIELEVQSLKSDYRSDYRDMLELITEKCTELLLQSGSPVSHYFEIDYARDAQTLYQKFSFIKSVIGTDEFNEAVHRVVTTPVTRWSETIENIDVRNTKRLSNTNIKEILTGNKRSEIPVNHPFRKLGIINLPERISSVKKIDSVDTPENRFIKHALETFLKFCTDIYNFAKQNNHKKLINESFVILGKLESHLQHSVFRKISRPTTLRLNSPVLQRKEGYREVLRVWLMFDLAARLIWKGGQDIYDAGKKDIAVLYEYWLFFKLLDLIQSIFDIEPKDLSELIKSTPDGLNLQLKQGKQTALSGMYIGTRKLQIRFNYNRPFSGKKKYPDSGSWTTSLRPDYTLSFWPCEISEIEAEREELIVHIHFDAKYKIANIFEIKDEYKEDELNNEKMNNRKGIYKNADLLKMHAYKDAIRRTGGAYVLYPGDKSINQKGFHEIIPGLGAFPVRPSKFESGIEELKEFIINVLEHFINRASQREKTAYRIFDIHKSPPPPEHEVRDALPEAYGENRSMLPDETFVLVGYVKSEKHWQWIEQNELYNFRLNISKGKFYLSKEIVNAKFLLLHCAGMESSGDLWKISKEPRVVKKEVLEKLKYPNPTQDNYLVLKIEKVDIPEFRNVCWEFKKFKGYKRGRATACPFSVSLIELMNKKEVQK